MTKPRIKFTAEHKAEIVRRHLKDKIPISSLAEEKERGRSSLFARNSIVLRSSAWTKGVLEL